MTRRALVLAGGGQRGAYEAGVIKSLIVDRGLRFDAICGTSIGAYNASFLAQWPKQRQAEAAFALEELWLSLRDKDIKKRRYLAALLGRSIYDTRPAKKFIKKNICPKRIAASGVELRVVYVDLVLGLSFTADQHDPHLRDCIYSSGAFPGAFEPGTVRGRACVDGGVLDNVPLEAARRTYPEEIYVVIPSPAGAEVKRADRWTNLTVLTRCLTLMGSELESGDLAGSGDRVFVIRPKEQLDVGLLDFDPQEIQMMLDQGEFDGKEE